MSLKDFAPSLCEPSPVIPAAKGLEAADGRRREGSLAIAANATEHPESSPTIEECLCSFIPAVGVVTETLRRAACPGGLPG